jgi:hypothetical protein
MLRGLLLLAVLALALRFGLHHAESSEHLVRHFTSLEPFHPEIFHDKFNTSGRDVFFEGRSPALASEGQTRTV